MHLPTTTRIAALVLSLAALTGCPEETGRFDFQDSWRGELTDQTYAVGANMDIVVYGPSGYDMNTTVARSIAGDDTAPVRLDRTEPYPEFGCIIASGEAEVPGDGRIAVADKFTRQPLDSVAISTDTIDGIGLGRGINLWNGTLDADMGTDLNVLSGGSVTLGVAPTNLEGDVLSGNLLVGASFTGGDVEAWDSTVELWGPADGILDLSMGDFSRQVQVATVSSEEVTSLEVETLSMGTRGDMQEMQGETLLVVSGITDDGRKVVGLDAEWTVDGWDYGVGDQMWSYGSESGSVCWNDLCASF